MTRTTQERAERLFRQKQEGIIAMSEYEQRQEATRRLTEKLRQERLAREAQDAVDAQSAEADQRAPRAKKRA